MTSDRKKPGVAFWATVVVTVVLVGYPLSFGPACWITSRLDRGASAVQIGYRPMTCMMSASERVAHALDWYARLGAAEGWFWARMLYTDSVPNKWEWTWQDQKIIF